MTKVQNAEEILPKVLTPSLGRTNVTDDRQTDKRQTDLRQQSPERNVVTFGLISYVLQLNAQFTWELSCRVAGPLHGGAGPKPPLPSLQRNPYFQFSGRGGSTEPSLTVVCGQGTHSHIS